MAAATLVALGGILASVVVSASGNKGPRTPYRVGAREIAPVWSTTPARLVARATLVPTLQRGAVGWGVQYQGGVTGTVLPRFSSPLFPFRQFGTNHDPYAKVEVIFTNPYVAAVSLGAGKPVATHPTGMPYGFRVAVLPVDRVPVGGPAGSGSRAQERRLPDTPVRAYDAHGRRLLETTSPRSVKHGPVVSWQRPQHPPPGRCELRASGLNDVSFARGHVVLRVWPHTGIVGRAFQSCADTTYFIKKTSGPARQVTAAILLDAAHPGVVPARLPSMRPLAGDRRIFEVSGTGAEEGLAARRLPNAWLVVAGGSGPLQRLEVLRHMHASIHL